jgi:hypothetical protein
VTPSVSRQTTPSASLAPTTLVLSTSTIATAATCTATVVPNCEYGVGQWWSKPLPYFNDHNTCTAAVASCLLQTADCYTSAGYPSSVQCAALNS